MHLFEIEIDDPHLKWALLVSPTLVSVLCDKYVTEILYFDTIMSALLCFDRQTS